MVAIGETLSKRVILLLAAVALCESLDVKDNFSPEGSTSYIVSLRHPADPPSDFDPLQFLRQETSKIASHVPNRGLRLYENFAKHMRMYLFSIQLTKSEDIAKLGDFNSEMKLVEAVQSFHASELVTDVSNLAHGLPYRQVLNRPFREMQEISGSSAEVQNVACTIEADTVYNLTSPVGLDTSERAYGDAEAESNVTVFVLDTGVQSDHTWFTPGQVSGGFDFYSFQEDKNASSGTTDLNGHGTQIAGIIIGSVGYGRADTNKRKEYTNIVPVRVLDSDGNGKTDAIIAGLDYSIESYFRMKAQNPRTSNSPQSHLPAIIHMSFSGRSSKFIKVVINAISKVMPVVGSSGDDDSFSCWTTPADCTGALTVGASGSKSNLPISGSNFGECISIFAPGDEVLSSFIGDSRTEEKPISGSSAAAAIATSILANVFTVIDRNLKIRSAFHNQIAEVDVAVFLKAVVTEALLQSSARSNAHGETYSEVHNSGYYACAIDSHESIKIKLEERLQKTASKSFLGVVEYDEEAQRVNSPTQRLRNKFKELKKKRQGEAANLES